MRNIFRFIGWFFVLGSFVFVLFSIPILIERIKLSWTPKNEVIGEVKENVIVVFSLDNIDYECRVLVNKKNYKRKVGERVSVLYAVNKPTLNMINTKEEKGFHYIIIIVFLVFEIIGGVFVYFSTPKKVK